MFVFVFVGNLVSSYLESYTMYKSDSVLSIGMYQISDQAFSAHEITTKLVDIGVIFAYEFHCDSFNEIVRALLFALINDVYAFLCDALYEFVIHFVEDVL